MNKKSEDRAKAIETAKRWASGANNLFLDTETTGVSAYSEICDLAFVNMAGETVFESLIRPKRSIPPEVTAIHHIDNDMVAGAPTFADVLDKVLELCAGRLVIAYNMEFDCRLMVQSALAHGWELTPNADLLKCAMKLYGAFRGVWNERYGNYKWHKLGLAASQCCIPLPAESLHRARVDADLGRQILLHMANAQ